MANLPISSSGFQFPSAALIIFLFITAIVSVTEGRHLELLQGREMISSTNQMQTVVSRRKLIGSAPPSCLARCGRCHPCRPVQVAIHPGMLAPMEYYPIVWRCQCGNKLYVP